MRKGRCGLGTTDSFFYAVSAFLMRCGSFFGLRVVAFMRRGSFIMLVVVGGRAGGWAGGRAGAVLGQRFLFYMQQVLICAGGSFFGLTVDSFYARVLPPRLLPSSSLFLPLLPFSSLVFLLLLPFFFFLVLFYAGRFFFLCRRLIYIL